jgi:hypothetical protein
VLGRPEIAFIRRAATDLLPSPATDPDARDGRLAETA